MYLNRFKSSANVTFYFFDFRERSEPRQILFAVVKVASLSVVTLLGNFETLGSKFRYGIP
ncbi:hypothetical protein BU202_02185 [Streptococcus cuniculi]|uniref:Uncharacterized protein n=1 Tax=Streptococcus cuniculi TaxID=1432788 RepID=A0A1Q8E9H1_9STRE|nr:hypothetical protein BU202_02185 [Streptococcus cuniculi]